MLEGLAQPSTAQRLPYGNQQLAELLAKQLAARGISSIGGSGGGSSGSSRSSAALDELARSIVRVAASSEEAAAAAGVEASTHVLPDGQTITIEREGLQLGEALMDGSKLGLDLPRLSEAVFTAATAQGDKESRKVGGAEGGAGAWPGKASDMLVGQLAVVPGSSSHAASGAVFPSRDGPASLRHCGSSGCSSTTQTAPP